VTTTSTVAARIVAALGDALARRGGAQFEDLVDGYAAPIAPLDDRLRPVARGWPAAFDLGTTPDPAFIGTATGTDVPGGLTLEQQREYVRDRAAWRRGTPEAIKGAVRQLLTGTRRVDLFERDGSPWHLRVQTYSAESTGVTEDDVRAAAGTQKPVGITLSAEVALGASYEHHTAEHATYEDFTAAYSSYDEASIHVPEEGTAP
jgi:hypothetical protein